MSFSGPKRGALDYFLAAKNQVAFGVAEAVAQKRPAVLLTGAAGLTDEERRLVKEYGLALLGPESYGVAAPHEGVDHSLSLAPILPGSIGLVTQSGALGAAVLDWAHAHGVGFSKFIALGLEATIGLGECIDYLADDPYTKSILLYMEQVDDARWFLSAARECALKKPLLVLKPGRGDGQKDSVYDAAFRRCGILRVSRMADLFYMAEVLEQQPRPRGPRLAILTNAHGPALLAADALRLNGGEPPLIRDLGGTAGPEEYRAAFAELAASKDCHGILLIVTPQPATRVTETARALAAEAAKCHKTLLASLMGGKLVGAGEALLSAAGVPTFPYADTAAKVFQRLWLYARVLNGLYETPRFTAEVEDSTALAADLEGRVGALAPAQLNRLLSAYGMAWSRGRREGAVAFAVTSRPDEKFGPVLEVAAGGVAGEVYQDRVATLPPLTSTQARRALDLVQLCRALTPEAVEALTELLVRFARMVSELPRVREWALTVCVEADGTIWAAEAAAELQPEGLAEEEWPKCVIRPYPNQYVRQVELRDGQRVDVRPIRPDDEERIVDFHNDLSERSVYLRYMQVLKFEERISHERLARVCFNDYDRELALVAVEGGKILGVGRMQRNPLRREEAEVAFLVRDSAQGRGIGQALVGELIGAARAEGLKRLTAELLSDNGPMRRLLEKQGFRMRLASDGQTLLGALGL